MLICDKFCRKSEELEKGVTHYGTLNGSSRHWVISGKFLPNKISVVMCNTFIIAKLAIKANTDITTIAMADESCAGLLIEGASMRVLRSERTETVRVSVFNTIESGLMQSCE